MMQRLCHAECEGEEARTKQGPREGRKSEFMLLLSPLCYSTFHRPTSSFPGLALILVHGILSSPSLLTSLHSIPTHKQSRTLQLYQIQRLFCLLTSLTFACWCIFRPRGRTLYLHEYQAHINVHSNSMLYRGMGRGVDLLACIKKTTSEVQRTGKADGSAAKSMTDALAAYAPFLLFFQQTLHRYT